MRFTVFFFITLSYVEMDNSLDLFFFRARDKSSTYKCIETVATGVTVVR